MIELHARLRPEALEHLVAPSLRQCSADLVDHRGQVAVGRARSATSVDCARTALARWAANGTHTATSPTTTAARIQPAGAVSTSRTRATAAATHRRAAAGNRTRVRAAYPSTPFIATTSPIQARAPPTSAARVWSRRADRPGAAEEGQDPHRCEHHLDDVLHGDAQPPWLVVVDLRCVGAVEGRTGSPPVGPEPQDRHGHPRGGREPAAGGIVARHPDAVGEEEGPGLGPIPREEGQQGERPPVTAGEVLVDRPQREGRGPRRRVPFDTRRTNRGPPSGVRTRKAAARPPATAPASRRPSRYGADEREQAARPPDHQPHRGSQVPDRRQGSGDEHRQRLPRRAAGRVEVEVGNLTPPHQPRPRVIGEGDREEQRQRRDRHTAADQETGAPVVVHSGRARTVTAPSTVTSTRWPTCHRVRRERDCGRCAAVERHGHDLVVPVEDPLHDGASTGAHPRDPEDERLGSDDDSTARATSRAGHRPSAHSTVPSLAPGTTSAVPTNSATHGWPGARRCPPVIRLLDQPSRITTTTSASDNASC